MDSITVLQTGYHKEDAGIFFGGVPWASYRQWADIGLSKTHMVKVPSNVLLLQMQNKNILIDAGFGNQHQSEDYYDYSPDTLQKRLRDQGMLNKEIDLIIITSPDRTHWGGIGRMRDDGSYWKRFRHAHIITVPPGDDEGLLLDKTKYEWELLTSGCIMPGLECLRVNGNAIITGTIGGEHIAYLGDICPTVWHMLAPICNDARDNHRGDTIRAKEEAIRDSLDRGSLVVFAHGGEVKGGYLERTREGIGFRSVL